MLICELCGVRVALSDRAAEKIEVEPIRPGGWSTADCHLLTETDHGIHDQTLATCHRIKSGGAGTATARARIASPARDGCVARGGQSRS